MTQLCIIVTGCAASGFAFHGPFEESTALSLKKRLHGCVLDLEESDYLGLVRGEPRFVVVNTNEPNMPWQVHGPFETEEEATDRGGYSECGVWWVAPLGNDDDDGDPKFRNIVRAVLKETAVAEAA